jgi:hypothetical protein
MIFVILDWVSFLTHPNLFGIKGFVVVVSYVHLCCKANDLFENGKSFRDVGDCNLPPVPNRLH